MICKQISVICKSIQCSALSVLVIYFISCLLEKFCCRLLISVCRLNPNAHYEYDAMADAATAVAFEVLVAMSGVPLSCAGTILIN